MLQPRARTALIIMFALSVTAGLSACGQKGDLYHPEDRQASAVVDARHS